MMNAYYWLSVEPYWQASLKYMRTSDLEEPGKELQEWRNNLEWSCDLLEIMEGIVAKLGLAPEAGSSPRQ